MMGNTEKEIIKVLYEKIMNEGKFPKFGSPEIKCDKCMFYKIACFPSSEFVGCYHGWKQEED